MRIVLIGLVVALAGCSTREPLVDRINVSDAKYNRDVGECRDQARGGILPFTGGSMSDCMRGKGYKVLMGGGL